MISSNCEVGSTKCEGRGRRTKVECRSESVEVIDARTQSRVLEPERQHAQTTGSTNVHRNLARHVGCLSNKAELRTSTFALRPSYDTGVLHCAPMPTWKLTIEYKGTRYLGWQEQKQGRTVQGALRDAAEDYFGEKVDLGGSGRTDAGVHALAQVAHLRAVKKRSTEPIQAALNERLPADIHVLKVESVAERFHARHSAIARQYLYQISTRRTAFAKDYVWWVKSRLDLARMEQCAQAFVGKA